MRRFVLLLITVLVIAVAGIVVFLATWDIPPPTKNVEKVIPNDRLGK